MVQTPENMLGLITTESQIDGTALAIIRIPNATPFGFPAHGNRVSDQQEVNVTLTNTCESILVSDQPPGFGLRDGNNRVRLLGVGPCDDGQSEYCSQSRNEKGKVSDVLCASVSAIHICQECLAWENPEILLFEEEPSLSAADRTTDACDADFISTGVVFVNKANIVYVRCVRGARLPEPEGTAIKMDEL